MNNEMVKIPKLEHRRLLQAAASLETLQEVFFKTAFAPPATRDATTVLKEMKKIGKYNTAFLKSLSRGLKESSYFRI
jgi:hypothetical protein